MISGGRRWFEMNRDSGLWWFEEDRDSKGG